MSDKLFLNKFILIAVYNPIQFDARVIRSAEALNDMGENVVVISYNSALDYKNSHFNSVVFSGKNTKLSLLKFWFNILLYSFINRRNIKLIYLHDYYLCGIGNLVSKITAKKWIYDAHELLIDSKKKKKSFRNRVFAYLEKINVKNADLVVAANYERERIMRYVYNLKNTINVLNIAPFNDTKENANKKGDVIIVYQGYLSKDRGLEDYINLLLLLPDKFKMKIIGDGPDIVYFKEKVAELFLNERVIFTGAIPYSQLINENKDCTIGIVSYSLNGLNNYYCSPNKLYEYAQLNMPMIFSPQPFLQKISSEYRIGVVLTKNMSSKEKANLIIDLSNNLSFYQENMKKFLSDYSHENEMNKLKLSVQKLL